jgi:hypothetical protein
MDESEVLLGSIPVSDDLMESAETWVFIQQIHTLSSI